LSTSSTSGFTIPFFIFVHKITSHAYNRIEGLLASDHRPVSHLVELQLVISQTPSLKRKPVTAARYQRGGRKGRGKKRRGKGI
jgi:hypothetical protein